jgi:2-amino-4-hydroxy-6-hydroxymethyldihydropteridine diphosphokinase
MALVNVYFSLGSNLGDREKNITEALGRMDEAFGRHYEALSKFIETEPMGFSGDKFLNAAVLYRIRSLSGAEGTGPERVLDIVKAIERSMGRIDRPEYDASGERIYHSRVIDIDILFYGKETIDTPRLTIPHKGISDRPFVMIPLLEIARPSLKKAFPDYFKRNR